MYDIAAHACSITMEFLAITEPTMMASRSVQLPLSNSGRRSPTCKQIYSALMFSGLQLPLTKALGLYNDFLSAWYKWKLSRLYSARSSLIRGKSTKE